MRRIKPPARRPLRGFTLLEVSAASMILIVTCALMAQLLFLVSRQERAAELRQTALRAVANRLEQLQARGWDELPVAKAAEEAAPAEVLALQPQAIMRTEVTAAEEEAVRQIRVQIEWPDAVGNRMEPISLSAWKHRPATAASSEAQP